ncbi:hypothetical protein XAP6164_4330044 [Xanthomonas phaseoli pv. phaseoli]|nr:hypothetical protein XAP6164_4330044 [Xanthomonas phaseoli pv. phaseoli]
MLAKPRYCDCPVRGSAGIRVKAFANSKLAQLLAVFYTNPCLPSITRDSTHWRGGQWSAVVTGLLPTASQ